MKKIVAIVIILASVANSTLAMEVQKSQATTSSMPMLIIVDQNKQENPTVKELQALTLDLFSAVTSTIKFPVLVTKSVLYNLLQRKEDQSSPDHPENYTFQSLFFEPYNGKTGWKVYEVQKGGLFLLMIPESFLTNHQSNSGLNIDSAGNSIHKDLHDITEQFKEKNYLDMLTQLAETQGKFSADNLKAVFKAKEPYKEKTNPTQPSWNIILNGHGSRNVAIGDLDKSQLQSFLSFLNKAINTQLLFVMSCYAGGINRIQFKEAAGNQIGNSLNYLVILQGVTDTYTYTMNFEPGFFNRFFYYANATDTGKGLNELLKVINSGLEYAGLLHPTAHIPQVLLPGGLEFQTFNIEEKVLSLGYVPAEKYRLESKPIVVRSKEAVLVYPRLIPATVQVDITAMEWNTWQTRLDKWKHIPVAFELLERENIQSLEPTPELPAYSKYRNYFEPSKGYYPAAKLSLYPQFIAMNPKQDQYWVKKISVLSKKEEKTGKSAFLPDVQEGIKIASGVMQFIRDAFGEELGGREQDWFIDELVGPNDLSLLLELSRTHKGITEKHTLEKLLQDSIGKEITLRNVEIITPVEGERVMNKLYVIFTLDDSDSAWETTLYINENPKSYYWDFKETSLKTHREDYNEQVAKIKKSAQLEESQKKLPEILQKRAEEIAKMPK